MINFPKNFKGLLLNSLPIILLFFLVISEFQFTYKNLDYISFNFIQILIFYWVLRKPEILGYGFIFLAGIINDIVIGLPLGISSIQYLILCGFAAYLRNLTLRPTLLNDWFAFGPSILITNSTYFLIITSYFSYDVNYVKILLNTLLTFLLYPIISFIFNILSLKISKDGNAS